MAALPANSLRNQTKPTVIIIMGVSGAGKSTVGRQLAGELGWQFMDADDFHSQANKIKMHSGVALTDEDRAPWLRSMAESIGNWLQSGKKTVLACSALKESYRDILRGGHNAVAVVYLHADFDVLAKRLEQRKNHFMNKDLLKSQLATLEEPAVDTTNKKTEDPALVVNADLEPGAIVANIRRLLNL